MQKEIMVGNKTIIISKFDLNVKGELEDILKTLKSVLDCFSYLGVRYLGRVFSDKEVFKFYNKSQKEILPVYVLNGFSHFSEMIEHYQGKRDWKISFSQVVYDKEIQLEKRLELLFKDLEYGRNK